MEDITVSDKVYKWAMKAAEEWTELNPEKLAGIISRVSNETGLVGAVREMMDGYRDAPANLADALRRALARATETEP